MGGGGCYVNQFVSMSAANTLFKRYFSSISSFQGQGRSQNSVIELNKKKAESS